MGLNMASLLTTQGTRIDISAKDVYRLGRDAGCDILVDDLASSRMHAMLRVAEQAVTIEDLGSRNGTYVNDARLTEPAQLDDNSRIRIGSVTYMLSFVDAGQSLGVRVSSNEVPEGTVSLSSLGLHVVGDEMEPSIQTAAEIAGQIGPFSVADVLRFVLASTSNGSLRFAFESCEGQIEIRGGLLWHATAADGLGGEAALAAITEMTAGLFWFVPGSGPAQRTIFAPSPSP